MRHFRILLVIPLSSSPLLLHFSSSSTSLLQFDRSAITSGEVWRVFTCHFTHWSSNHLLWSGGGFALLLPLALRDVPKRLLACMLIAMVAISGGVYLLTDLQFYRGLSGIDASLVALLITSALVQAIQFRHRLRAVALIMLAGIFSAKMGWELITGGSLFVHGSDVMVPVPLAHFIGTAVGVACALLHWPNTGRNPLPKRICLETRALRAAGNAGL